MHQFLLPFLLSLSAHLGSVGAADVPAESILDPVPPTAAIFPVDAGACLGFFDIAATPYPKGTGDLISSVNGVVGNVTFELLPPANPTDTFGNVMGTVTYGGLGTTSTFYQARWFNFDGTQGAVGQTGIIYAYPQYQPLPIGVGSDIIRILYEWKVSLRNKAGGPWSHQIVL